MSHRLNAKGISLDFRAKGGVVTDLVIEDEGHRIAPYHHAPWAEKSIDLPEGAPAHQAWLQGDFLAAPFGPSAFGLHGAANLGWTPLTQGADHLRAVLDHPIHGASVIKEISLEDDHPFLYQRHLFIGGQGALPVANHAMFALGDGAKLSFSRKRWFETSAETLESDPARGRSKLAYPRRSEDPSAFPAQDGGSVDLLTYPWGEAHEDFVSALEEPSSTLGWTAIARPAQKDLILTLRDPRKLPMTALWHSNGGRDYAPWNGSHRGCLGVEEGALLTELGLSSRESPDPLSAAGQPPLLQLQPLGAVEIRHITGALHWPSGQRVANVMLEGDLLTVTGDWGAERKLPIRGAWLRDTAASEVQKPKLDPDWPF